MSLPNSCLTPDLTCPLEPLQLPSALAYILDGISLGARDFQFLGQEDDDEHDKYATLLAL